MQAKNDKVHITLEENASKTIKHLKKFISFDKYENSFYNNLYLDDDKIVIKIPLIIKQNSQEDVKVEKFDLAKYTFLLTYELDIKILRKNKEVKKNRSRK